MVKGLKLLTCQGSEVLAGGGGFSPVLSPAKKILTPSQQICNTAVENYL
ncbi:hypothetical protein NWP26_07985 [Chrysosporum ovalisporum APH033B]|uniref:Uncharacterized protein n=2 Tax=Umezakia ovalisporum TaxID=75695 RepID=A0ABT6K517_9CYAN|nr:hypothetical protein [Umezakia ovalisporum]MDH6057075.1 hypothetical protein [Umezakia ovalisporum FSS-43]MDH6067194.1 hypothetical protein [Umezakia ovalisporum APH033B]